jgi:tRNA (cmo5U34)-methyltransferase
MAITEPAKKNEYLTIEHALTYFEKADDIPHRMEGEAVVLELLPSNVHWILDLGAGDGRLLALAKLIKPEAHGVAMDFSPTMLEKARLRFKEEQNVSVIEHNLNNTLPDIGTFDVVLSSFAIHHLSDERKQAIYSEVFNLLEPGGIFCNLEHVASPTQKLHEDFYHSLGATIADEDPSNQCTSVEIQLSWLRTIGFENVDCFWKWRELALLAGVKPTGNIS